MTLESKSNSCQNAPWEWNLVPHTATALPAARTLRWIQVSEGQVWLTGGAPGAQAQDVWLQAGDRHALPAGTQWVLEGWPRARLTLLQSRLQTTPSLLSRARAWWRAGGRTLPGMVTAWRLEP